MTKRNSNTRQPTQSNETAVTGDENTDNVIALIAPTDSLTASNTRKSLLARTMVSESALVGGKATMLQEVRQKLAQAVDMFDEGGMKATEAAEIADNAAIRLYTARTTGMINADEVTALLGDQFGFKAKADGTPGKTPEKRGEELRKRIVRATMASQYVRGNYEPQGGFFDGIPADAEDDDGYTVADIVNGIEQGGSLNVAYNRFTVLKRNASEPRVDQAFDAKHVTKLVGQLSNVEDAAKHLASNPVLLHAWGELLKVFAIADEAAVDYADEAVAA